MSRSSKLLVGFIVALASLIIWGLLYYLGFKNIFLGVIPFIGLFYFAFVFQRTRRDIYVKGTDKEKEYGKMSFFKKWNFFLWIYSKNFYFEFFEFFLN